MSNSAEAPVPHVEGTVELADGRHIGYAEYGDPNGYPVLWFHGTPGGRRQIPPAAPAAAIVRGIRVIGVARPGSGTSTYHLYDKVVDWAADIEELVDALGIDQFAAVGLSGGGPYVLACAHELPDRMQAAAVLGGLGPVKGSEKAPGYTQLLGMFEPFWGVARVPLSLMMAAAILPLKPFAHQAMDIYARIGPSSDRPVFERPEFRAMFIEDILLAAEYGLRAPVLDLALFSRHWGFHLADIEVPVRFWQGDADLIVPTTHGSHQANLVADGKLFMEPGIGHFAGFTIVDEVFDELRSCWSDAA